MNVTWIRKKRKRKTHFCEEIQRICTELSDGRSFLIYFLRMKKRERENVCFLRPIRRNVPVIIELRAAAFLPSIMFCNSEPGRRMSHSCDLMGMSDQFSSRSLLEDTKALALRIFSRIPAFSK